MLSHIPLDFFFNERINRGAKKNHIDVSANAYNMFNMTPPRA